MLIGFFILGATNATIHRRHLLGDSFVTAKEFPINFWGIIIVQTLVGLTCSIAGFWLIF